MPHKGGSKITWLKLWINLENFEEESQVEGVQTTLDALSESIQHGIRVGSLHVLVDFWRWLVPESHMVGWKMVCPETVSKQADMSILGAFESPHSYWVQAGSWRESDGLGGDCRWANPPCCLVSGISKFESIPRTSPQEYCLAISEEFGDTNTILVPARRRQLPRNGRVSGFSSCKIWRENNFTKDNSSLAPILPGLVASRLLILVPSNGTYNQMWAKYSNGAQEHRRRLRRGHEGGRYSEDGATYQEKSRAVQR